MRKSRKLLNFSILITTMPIITGCFFGYNLGKLEDKNLEGKEFLTVLAREYRDFSRSEAVSYDWIDSDYFARKGLRAASGYMIEPERPEDWDIPETALLALQEARKNLLETVNEKTYKLSPEASAKAYYLYDCWVEEQEENWQVEHIDSCRNSFFETLNYVSMAKHVLGGEIISIEEVKESDAISIDKSEKLDNLTAIETNTAIKEILSETGDTAEISTSDSNNNLKEKINIATKEAEKEELISYIVFFDPESSQLGQSGRKTIIDVIYDLSDTDNYSIVLKGMPEDNSYTEKQVLLTSQRAKAVKNELVDGGIDTKNIILVGFGEGVEKESVSSGKIIEVYIQ